MSAADRHDPFAPESSSSHQHSEPPSSEDRDELDFLGGDDDDDNVDRTVLEDDPIHHDEFDTSISFKRKSKPSLLASPGRLLSALTGSSGSGSGGDGTGSNTASRTPPRTPAAFPNLSSPRRTGGSNGAAALNTKDGSTAAAGALDWHIEGPGRRVGYDDLTAIDWIFEYTKERQRLRALTADAGSSLVGHARRLIDASQVWVVMVLTGLAVGAIAALINITADWLGDLKLGYCASGPPDGGHFYLNKGFCCYGYDQGSKCTGWRSWSDALGLHAAAGRWIMEYILYLFLSVLFALCAAVLVQEYSIHAKHSGIPEIKTILGGFVIRRLLGAWTLVAKSLGLVLAVASGMWLGREGPLVHVACCCANLFTKLFGNINGNEARKREVLSAAAAAGISVAFGSPIGGVLFSLEQLSYYFPDKTMWQSFVCAMTAAMSLQAFDPLRSGKLVLYQTKYSRDWHGFEILPYAILGIMGGVYGGLFIKTNMFVARWKKANGWLPGPITQVLAVALLTALINFPNHYMKVQSTELVSNLFQECSKVLEDPVGLCTTGAASARTVVLLLFAALLGFFLAAVTFGLQIPAGIILPSMAIGALVGRAVGILTEMLVDSHRGFLPFRASCAPDDGAPCVTPGTYAIIGAAAALAGVTRMTVSIVVIMFELTGALTYVLPIMVAVMLAKWVGDALARRGIYESWIHFNEYPFLDNSEAAPPTLLAADAAQVMTRIEDLVVLTATGHTIASLHDVLAAHPCRGFPVVSDPRDAVLLGYISRAELSYNVRAASAPPRSLPPLTEAFFAHQPLADPRTTLDLRPWMDQTPLTLPSRTSLHLVVSYFQKLGLRYVLFSDRGVLQGLLTKKDVWYVLNGADETRRTTAGGVRAGAGRAGGRGATGSGQDGALLVSDDEADDDGVARPSSPML
ncbi:voltage-gated chloride channel [Cordyceps fumosorosea ARSEF 2679]|uniref:Voltage-gated chloride channel n=1 Tax=Cordyceps fumosorosea (strain ARSEF 2679) TaxID=1081104 RepID=A0A168CHJ9_CORFA|nr:voltage-gated chloride channel [Cordyceps fumosorosea ARSEF 2679]OAA71383.1 voltage-gated chloride channel [Cordyceps fumosorosea ARSEF 2679]